MTLYKKRSLSFVNLQSFPIMSRLKSSSLVVAIMMLFLPISSLANEGDKLNKEQNLLSSCHAFKTATNNTQTLPCINYIEGFLNGVLNANNSNVEILLEDNNKSDTLVERAYANRVGNKARTNSKPIDYACLSMEKSKKYIIENLSNSSLSTIHTLEQLNARLVYILETSCSAENKKNN
ncbi:hypothetical protein ACM9HF_16270 [Colwellia sp. RE-S-Sl-9]